MCTSFIGKIGNPIGAIAPKSGAGQWLDPAGAIGRKVGGTAGKIIDPAGTVRDMQKQQAVQEQPAYATEETVLTQKKALAKKDDEL